MQSINNEELTLIRSQTPGTGNLAHFNNAGSSLPPDQVVEAVIEYLKKEALFGGYETEAKYIDHLSNVYHNIAKLVNADTDEIALFENASAAWGTAFKGLTFQEGDEIITTEMEYVTNLIGLVDMQKQEGVTVKVISNDENGNFSVIALEREITPNTKLIAVTHVSSSGGSILPVEEIGDIAEKYGILYLVDACQSAGQMPIDVRKIKCDMLSATGRKYLRAPRGTGFLFVKRKSLDKLTPVLLDFLAAGQVSLHGYTLRQDARRFELYEKSRALTIGLGAAVEYAINIGLDRIWERIYYLSILLRNQLGKIPRIVVRDLGDKLSGIVTFSAENVDSQLIKAKLSGLGINVSVGGSQATPIYMEKSKLQTLVRASVHYYNTEEEITKLCRALRVILEDE